jgi:membrane protease YdiL (CAAX protease family)
MGNSILAATLSHLLAAYLVLAAPWLGYFWYQRVRKRAQAGDPLAKVRLFRELVVEQIVTTALFCTLLMLGVAGPRLGLGAPRSWWLTAGLGVAIVLFLMRNALRTRPKAKRLCEKLQENLGTILPETVREQRWFALVSVGAGISEELAFRGFLFYYIGAYVPQANTLGKVLLTSAVFGMAHFYQGWKGVLKTGIVGLVLAGFYVLTGSLLLPIVVHSMVDLQVPIIFWPARNSLDVEPEASAGATASS